MKITFNRNDFVNKILAPVSKIADNLFLSFEPSKTKEEWKAKTLVSTADKQVILMAEIDCKIQEKYCCIIPDCKTFLRLFSGIEKESVTLEFDSNSIKYKDGMFSFKYHLLDESYMINNKSFNEEKLNTLNYDTSFLITKQKLSEIVKFNSIVPDAEKLYFLTDKEKVLVKLGDELKTNTNEITTEASTCFQGKPIHETLPMNIQSLLLFSFTDDLILVAINHSLKIFKFCSPQLTYIISGLVR
jgi:hypothetical protein